MGAVVAAARFGFGDRARLGFGLTREDFTLIFFPALIVNRSSSLTHARQLKTERHVGQELSVPA